MIIRLRSIFYSLACGIFGAIILSAMGDFSAASAGEEKTEKEKSDFNVAILHGVFPTPKARRHHDEFDVPVKLLGWGSKKYSSTIEDMNLLTGITDSTVPETKTPDSDASEAAKTGRRPEAELMKYDMVLGCPLFNVGKQTIDMTRYAKVFREFVLNGGALVMTDCLYSEIIDWIPAIDPKLAFGYSGACRAKNDPIDATPVSPFRFLPNTKRDHNSWGHLTLPEDSGWEVVLRCGEGHPTVLVKRMGKGFVYVTALRQPNKETLENLRANLELQRMGLVVTKFDMPEFKVGSGSVSITTNNTSEKQVSLTGELVIAPREGDEKPLSFSTSVMVNPQEKGTLAIPYNNGLRGELEVELVLKTEQDVATIFSRNVVVPALLTVLPPRYRSLALESELMKNGEIRIGYSIAPFEENVAAMTVTTSVVDSSSKKVGSTDKRKVSELSTRFPFKVGALAAGKYMIHSALFEKGRLLERQNAPFHVLKNSECKTFINDDMNLVVDGKPFFPIGIYHINSKDLEEYGSALGINTIQLFSWNGSALKVADKLGIKVIWEQNHRNPENAGRIIKDPKAETKLIDQPSIIAWYAKDEPYENELEWSQNLSEAFHKADVGRPTFMVSCQPRLFNSHAGTADIMAPDPYPYWKNDDRITAVADWVDLAWKATKGDKPVICVPQSFGHEPEGPFRAMAYLALAHEARGLIWYPWDDGKNGKNPNGGIGLKYNPKLQKVFSQVVSEVKTLSPALLNKEGRRQFKSEDEKIHGLYCQETPKKRYLLLVNPHDEENTIDPRKLDGLEGVSELKELFGEGKIQTSDELTLKPYETKAYTWQ